MIGALVATVAVVAAYVWQDGMQQCPDGARYTSGKPQPYPFHRRFCGWTSRSLSLTSVASLVTMGALMGDWKRALLFVTLPGAWFISTRPTTVDAPAMLLAWCAGLAFPTQPYVAVGLACVSGFIHERGPVFAALYAWHWLPLAGLVAVGWWRTKAPPDADIRVGRGFATSFVTHRQDHDWLDWKQSIGALRVLPLAGAFFGLSTGAWLTLALGWGQRLICSDLGRLTLWAAPAMIRELPDLPAWVVMVHAVTFRRMD